MSERKALCPYCGHPMRPGLQRYDGMKISLHAVCEGCGSCGPFVSYEGMDIFAARVSTTTKILGEMAMDEALRRPLRRPMTLQGLRALIDAGKEAVIYCEIKNDKQEIFANILYDGRIFDRYGKAPGPRLLRYETYGKTWRAWASRPTKEERNAEPWEDSHE